MCSRTDAMTYRTRRKLAVLVLVIGLPAYIILAVGIVGQFERPSFLLELAIYVGLGVLWALPLRGLFRGIGQADPDEDTTDK